MLLNGSGPLWLYDSTGLSWSWKGLWDHNSLRFPSYEIVLVTRQQESGSSFPCNVKATITVTGIGVLSTALWLRLSSRAAAVPGKGAALSWWLTYSLWLLQANLGHPGCT